MAKDLKSILAGVKSSKIAPPEIDDKNLYQWNSKDGVAFIKKHKIEKHEDRVGNGDDVYKGKTKKADYKIQGDGVYEETEINEISRNLALKYRKKSLEDTAKRAGEEIRSGKKSDGKKEQKRSEGRLLAHNKTFNIGGKKAKVSATGLLTHTNEEVIEEGNKENKAKKKSLPKPEKKNDFDTKLRDQLSGYRRGRKMEEETELDELSNETLSSYVTGAALRLAGGTEADNRKKESNRITGINTAIKKLHPENSPAPANEEIELGEKYMGFHALKGELSKKGAKSPGALAAWIGRKKYGKEKFQSAAAADKKLGESSCNHTMEGEHCPVHEKAACPSEDDVNLQKKSKKDEKGREYLADKKKCMEEIQYIDEVLTAKDPVSKWIHDFVHSDNPKFAGKSIKERQKMALGAYYSKKRGSSAKESGSATNTDYTGPGAAGWTTGRHDMGTL